MEFTVKEKPKTQPREYGHTIKVKCFAWLPVRIGDKRIWLESYYATKEWTKSAGTLIYDGMFVKVYADAWVTVERERNENKVKPTKVTQECKESLKKSYPYGDRWTYRIVKRVTMKGAFYIPGQILKIKHFGTFGAFDYKNRWIDYYDVGKELRPTFWVKLWFHITKFF